MTIRNHGQNGLEGALGMLALSSVYQLTVRLIWLLGASGILLFSSLPRVTKGPLPVLLTVTAALSTLYYGRLYSTRL
jgi:uncharacterized membrane protein (UPF0136 family)